MKPRVLLRVLLIFISLAIVAGCCLTPDPSPQGDVPDKKMYLDAELGFVLDLPTNWIRISPRRKPAGVLGAVVAWQIPPSESLPVPPVLHLKALNPQDVRRGFDSLKKQFFDKHPRAKVDKSERMDEFPYPNQIMTIHDSGTTFLVVFVTSYHKAYVLEFSCPKNIFADMTPLFLDIAHSFRILESNR